MNTLVRWELACPRPLVGCSTYRAQLQCLQGDQCQTRNLSSGMKLCYYISLFPTIRHSVIPYSDSPCCGMPFSITQVTMVLYIVLHSRVQKFLQWGHSSPVTFIQWTAPSLTCTHPFQHDHPLAGITALDPTRPWYLLLLCHFTQLSAF